MGVDLTLFVADDLTDEGLWRKMGRMYVRTVLKVPRRRDAWDSVCGLPAQPMPADLYENSFEYLKDAEDYHHVKLTEDKYGAALCCVRAEPLADVLRSHVFDETDRMRAVVAFLDAVPANTLVVLWWH